MDSDYIGGNNLSLIQKRAEILAQAESLAKLTAKKPDYTPVLPNAPIVNHDLIAEHNTRYILARMSVLNMKVQYKWSTKNHA